MNLLVPCAGEGQRFKNEGYDLPKPLIEVLEGSEKVYGNRMTMLSYVLNDISHYDFKTAIFLFQKKHFGQYPRLFDETLKDCSIKNKEVILVDKLTDGAACTALLAKNLINNNDPLVITDCDHIIDDPPDVLQKGCTFFQRKNADAGLWCHLADHPKWSYTRVKDGQAIEIIEKQVISDLANTGDYYFKKGSDFVEAAERMIAKNDRTKGEFYISGVYSYLIADGKKVLPYMVNEMIGLGTPEDLENYKKKINE